MATQHTIPHDTTASHTHGKRGEGLRIFSNFSHFFCPTLCYRDLGAHGNRPLASVYIVVMGYPYYLLYDSSLGVAGGSCGWVSNLFCWVVKLAGFSEEVKWLPGTYPQLWIRPLFLSLEKTTPRFPPTSVPTHGHPPHRTPATHPHPQGALVCKYAQKNTHAAPF